MLKFINSKLIPNFYLRIFLLVSIIAISTYIREETLKEKKSYGSINTNYFYLNYFINIIIFFVIPIFFQIDNIFVSLIIKYFGMLYNFVYSIMNLDLFPINLVLSPFLILLF